jgi:hypothetical protein
MEQVRVIVTGDRRWHCLEVAGVVVNRLLARYGVGLVVVHGAAPGVDSAFAEACDDLGVVHESHPADWDRFGKAAGPIRNEQMVAAGAALCVAVHRDLTGSRGTRHCVGRCLAAGIPVWLIDSDRVTPKRVASLPA